MRGTVVYIAEDRKKESLDGYFSRGTKKSLQRIEAIATDIWDPYIASIRDYVPDYHTKLVFDRYHLMVHIMKAVDTVRKREHCNKEKVSASTQNQALAAILFLYRHVLKREVGELGDVIRARKPKRLPVVMIRDEVKAVLAQLEGDKWLMASIMYGAGLRLIECLRLRVQDVDFARNEIIVRDGKGAKDRVTMLPESLKEPLQNHLQRIKKVHQRDLKDGWGGVPLPDALNRKYPNASREWR
jgi:integrase